MLHLFTSIRKRKMFDRCVTDKPKVRLLYYYKSKIEYNDLWTKTRFKKNNDTNQKEYTEFVTLVN